MSTAAPAATPAAAYQLPQLPNGIVALNADNASDKSILKWSGEFPIPQIGARVLCRVNGIGHGRVESYFTEYGYVGVIVGSLENDPEWHVKQTAGHWHAGKALVFGNELSAA